MLAHRIARPIAAHSPRVFSRSMAGIAAQKAKELQALGWKGTTTDGGETKSFINGQWVSVGNEATKWWDVTDPVSWFVCFFFTNVKRY